MPKYSKKNDPYWWADVAVSTMYFDDPVTFTGKVVDVTEERCCVKAKKYNFKPYWFDKHECTILKSSIDTEKQNMDKLYDACRKVISDPSYENRVILANLINYKEWMYEELVKKDVVNYEDFLHQR